VKLWRKWTPHEDDFLRKYYGKWHSMQIANALGRPQKSVWNRAQQLKLISLREATRVEQPKEEPEEEKTVGLARHSDPFGRPLAVFCIKNITVHRLAL
jgi:hypothetical protein